MTVLQNIFPSASHFEFFMLTAILERNTQGNPCHDVCEGKSQIVEIVKETQLSQEVREHCLSPDVVEGLAALLGNGSSRGADPGNLKTSTIFFWLIRERRVLIVLVVHPAAICVGFDGRAIILSHCGSRNFSLLQKRIMFQSRKMFS